MKTAISIPDPIFKSAEDFAQDSGMSRSELYTKAVQEYIAARKQRNITEALNAVYATESSKLDDAFLEMQRKSIPEEAW